MITESCPSEPLGSPGVPWDGACGQTSKVQGGDGLVLRRHQCEILLSSPHDLRSQGVVLAMKTIPKLLVGQLSSPTWQNKTLF